MPIYAVIMLIIAGLVVFGVITYTIIKTLKQVCTREPRQYLDPMDEETKDERY